MDMVVIVDGLWMAIPGKERQNHRSILTLNLSHASLEHLVIVLGPLDVCGEVPLEGQLEFLVERLGQVLLVLGDESMQFRSGFQAIAFTRGRDGNEGGGKSKRGKGGTS